MNYLITFFTHYGAVKLSLRLRQEKIDFRMTPVPRSISSDCGTCICLKADTDPVRFLTGDAAALYRAEGSRYVLIREDG